MTPTTPIDIEPIGYSNSRSSAKQDGGIDPTETSSGGTHANASYHAPHYGRQRTAEKPPRKGSGRIGGAVQLVAGSALAVIGVPMLILPGPGLLAIGGGAVLAVNGARRLIGK